MRRAPSDRASWLRVAALCVAIGAAACLAGAAATGAREWPQERQRRLAELSPSEPVAYLELAEEIADRAPRDATGDADRALALQLAGKAGALDVQRLGRSAALLMADISRDPAQQARMSALADALGGVARAGASQVDTSAVLGLAQAFAAYRRGNGARARLALETKGTAALLDSHPQILAGGSARFRADCAAMRDGMAPAMSPAQMEALYALVSAALAPAPRSWGESLSLHGRDAVPDFDLSNPAALFGVTLP